MYDQRPNFVLGFHGCDEETCNNLINNPNDIKISVKPYDWLGHRMYFWENNYDRALLWAKEKKKKGTINKPSVIGAILQLGHCCDFTDSKFISLVKENHRLLANNYNAIGKELPKNKDIKFDKYEDKILRELDCTTIEFMHSQIFSKYQEEISAKGFSDFKIFDSTRGVFTEGGEAFPGSGIFDKSHIQICIRNFNSIKGFFLPRKEIDFP